MPYQITFVSMVYPKNQFPMAKRPVPIEFRQKVAHLGVTGGAHDVGDCPVTIRLGAFGIVSLKLIVVD